MSRSVRGPDYSLRIYPKHPDVDAYRVGGSMTPYAIVAVEKRFSDGELAAEWWRSLWAAEYTGTSYEEATVLERFCTLPNFDE